MAVSKVIPELPNGLKTFKQARECGLLVCRILFILEVLRDSLEAVVEVPFPGFAELIARKMILQEHKHEIIQCAVIEEEIPDRGGPIQTGGHYGNGTQSWR